MLCLSPLECKLCEDRELAILFIFVAAVPNIVSTQIFVQ